MVHALFSSEPIFMLIAGIFLLLFSNSIRMHYLSSDKKSIDAPSMRTFGTVLNRGFGDVEETGIMITVNDLYKAKVERHILNYVPKQLQKIKNIRRRDLKIQRLFRRFQFYKRK